MKLHIGGKQPKEGWTILNIQKLDYVDIVGDITDLSQFQDESMEVIYASHVLEHVSQQKLNDTLRGINRILKQGGVFYCSVPNMEVLAKLFLSEQLNVNQKWHVMRMMFGGQIDENDYHYVGWSLDFAKTFFGSAGFRTLKSVKSFNLFEDTSEYKPYGVQISLNLIAEK